MSVAACETPEMSHTEGSAEHHDHDGHHHGHDNDQGIKGALRYLRWFPQMWRSEINDAVVDLVEPLAGERVVDIGAGVGAGAIRAAAAGASVIAVEPTPFLRRVLTLRRTLSRRKSFVTVVDGTAEQLPVDDHSIDVVYAVNTLHHWVDVERGCAEVARVLAPGGRALLLDESFTDPSHPDHERFGGKGDPEHHGFTMVDADRVADVLVAAGATNALAFRRRIADRPVIGVAIGVAAATDT